MTNYDRPSPATPSPVVPAAPVPPPSYPEALARLLNSGWQMVSEGPSGAYRIECLHLLRLLYLRAALGVVLLFFAWPLGLLFILLAILDFAFFTKERTHFLSRDLPTMPT